MLSAIATALVFGFAGSFHCAFMCGPLALAGCTHAGRLRARNMLGYFGGRTLAYGFVGAVFGSLGAHAQHRLPTGVVQSGLLLVVAAAALCKGVALLRARRPGLVQLRRRPSRIAALLGPLLPRRGLPFGLATGVLPCGLLAGGWALAAASGGPYSGCLVMVAFSLATLPSLAATLLLAGRVRWRPSPALAGVLWCALALWMGLRPLLAHAAHGGH